MISTHTFWGLIEQKKSPSLPSLPVRSSRHLPRGPYLKREGTLSSILKVHSDKGDPKYQILNTVFQQAGVFQFS